MSRLPPIGYALLLVLIGVLLVFALGTRRNIRRGNALMVWLQDGLPLLGRKTTFRWLGSTAVVLKIAQANDPFREAEVVVVMEPRDVTLLWAWARRHGRRDFVIIRGWLRRAPRFELEAGDLRGWTGGDRLKTLDSQGWEEADWGEVRVAHSRDADAAAAKGIWDALAEASGGIWRLSVRREHPHLEVHVLPPDGSVPADRLFRAFREAGTAVARPG
jgi:hypothetical protein